MSDADTGDSERLSDKQFRVLLDLFMVSDPWPLSDGEFATVEKLLMSESNAREFNSYTDAYHGHEPSTLTDGGEVRFSRCVDCGRVRKLVGDDLVRECECAPHIGDGGGEIGR